MTTNPPTEPNDSSIVPTGLLPDAVRQLGEPIRDLLLYSSAYLAFIAVAEALIVTRLLSLRLTPAPLVAGLLTFAVYGTDRVADVETDGKTAPERAAFVRRHQHHLYTLSALSYGLAVALSVLGGPAAFALALVPGVVWVCYARDWLPCADGLKRLKQVFVLNSILVAGAWALVMVFLPVAFAGGRVTATTGVVFAFFFLGSFIRVEIPNVRDRAGDREIGVKTLPVVFGVEGTRYALYSVTSLTGALLVTAFVDGLLAPAETGWLLVSLLCLTGVVACLGRTGDNSRLTIAGECSRLPILVLLLVPLL